MKKYFTLFVTLLFLLFICACGKQKESQKEGQNESDKLGTTTEQVPTDGYKSIQIAPGNYKIEGQIRGSKDTIIYLGYHFGNRKFKLDSVKIGPAGNFVMQGPKQLDGIYMLITQDDHTYDILMTGKQQLKFTADAANVIGTMKFQGNPDNELFYNFQQHVGQEKGKIGAMRKQATSLPKGSSEQKALFDQIKKLESDLEAYRDDIIENQPNAFFSKVLKLMQIPKPSNNPDGSPLDSLQRMHYIRAHFFDGADFSDPRLIRTPTFYSKIVQFLNITPQNGDSLIVAAESMLDKAKAHPAVFQFTMVSIFNRYHRYWHPQDEKIYLHIAEKYYLSGLAPWVEEEEMEKIKKHASRIKPNMVGMKAPPLFGFDEYGDVVDLYDIKAKYTLIYFWSPSCDHCMKVTPDVAKILAKYQPKGLKVLGFCTTPELEKWTQYISKQNLNWIHCIDEEKKSDYINQYNVFGTPMVYVLDENKTIIAKRIPEQTLDKRLSEIIR